MFAMTQGFLQMKLSYIVSKCHSQLGSKVACNPDPQDLVSLWINMMLSTGVILKFSIMVQRKKTFRCNTVTLYLCKVWIIVFELNMLKLLSPQDPILVLTLNVLNYFKDYKRYIHILNFIIHILDLAWPK